MDCRTTVLLSLAVLLAVLIANTEGRKKKVVIHVPFKVKKIKHTHTVYKTIHHHHKHHDHDHDHDHGYGYDHGHDHSMSSSDEHEHFHHMHYHDEPPTAHSHPSSGIDIPDFLPDDTDMMYDIADVPRHEMSLPHRLKVPLYRRF